MIIKCEGVVFGDNSVLLDIVVKGVVVGCSSLLRSVGGGEVCLNSLENVFSGFFDERCVVSGEGCFLVV